MIIPIAITAVLSLAAGAGIALWWGRQQEKKKASELIEEARKEAEAIKKEKISAPAD